jgi:hypothetical protein
VNTIGCSNNVHITSRATNFVAHMMNGMNKALKYFIPKNTMPFLDDIPIKRCIEEDNG